MGRARKQLPEGFVEIDDKQVQCNICTDANQFSLEKKIMQRSNITKHIESQTHQNRQHALNMQREQEARQRQALEQAYAGPSAALPSFSLPATVPRPGLLTESNTNFDQPSFPFDPDFLHNTLIPTGVDLSVDDADTERQRLNQLLEDHLQQARWEDEHGEVEEDIFEDSWVNEEFTRRGINLDEDGNPLKPLGSGFNETASAYFPYPNKLIMLLDIMDSLPRLRLSSNHFRLLLWLLKQVGVDNVLGYDTFRKDFANPNVAQHLHLYPEEVESGPVSELWQCERMRDYSLEDLPPMYSSGLRKFYVGEVSQLRDGRFVIRRIWIVRRGILHADCYPVKITEAGTWIVDSDPKSVVSCKASDFARMYLEISASKPIPWDKSATNIPEMPNPKRKLVKPHQDLYVVPVPAWCDDVSGNKSKQYNKHMNTYTVNAAIPGRLLEQEYFIRFVSTSPAASASEQLAAVRDEIKATEVHPIECYNAHTKQECGVILRLPGLPADNPMQSELSSHIGGNGNCKCRRCKVGGAREEVETDEGYHALHDTGPPRTAEWVRETLQAQLVMASRGSEKEIQELQTATGVKDKTTQHWIGILLQGYNTLSKNPSFSTEQKSALLRLWLEEQPGDKMNPLLDVTGLDPSRDTPVEILHTILLGIMKYIWHLLHSTALTKDKLEEFGVRLQATDLTGLTVPPIRADYMLQYRNNLIGKHFKTLMQVIAFHITDLVDAKVMALVKAVSSLGAVLWVHEIDDMDSYLADLKVLIANVLDAFGDIQPMRIMDKMKIHVLAHLPEDIKRFGPAIRFSTEKFECYNAIFRLCSIYSNHQAPSRDIAKKLSSIDRVKHIISGGYWRAEDEWVCAGDRVLSVLQDEPIIQRHFGWVPPTKVKSGDIRYRAIGKSPLVLWTSTTAGSIFEDPLLSLPYNMAMEPEWRRGISVMSISLDSCGIGSWVCAEDSEGKTLWGRIVEILGCQCQHGKDLILLELFTVGDALHPSLELPVLRRVDSEDPRKRHSLLEPKAIKFLFSAQHDCRYAHCFTRGSENIRQEREISSITRRTVVHSEDQHFIINLHALHNANLLRRALPRTLTAPKPLFSDRRVQHDTMAVTMRHLRTEKRAKTQQKRKATMEAKKIAAAANVTLVVEVPPEEEQDSDGSESDGAPEPESESEAEDGPGPTKRKRTN